MIKELSLPCQYKVSLNTSDYTYRFTSDSGAVFSVGFTLTNGVFSGTPLDDYVCHTIEVYKTQEGNGKRDKKVSEAIDAIVGDYFSEEGRLLFYICDDSDGRQLIRKRMFNIWIENSVHRKSLLKLDGDVEGEVDSFYSSLIFHSDHPEGLENIEKAFNETQEDAKEMMAFKDN